ncbi:MAG: DNA-directed RNA polymerase subunit alpha, partial [Nitrospinota bacterium]
MSAAVQNFIKPGKLEADSKTLTETYGKFTAGPFERGFGVTIGNSLRRHLLSYIEGSAVTSVKFDGVFHEFSTLPGVTEDVADIILNIKELRLMLESDTPKKIYLESEGKGVLTAGDISGDPSVTILNPDHKIATLDVDGKIHLEMTVKKG